MEQRICLQCRGPGFDLGEENSNLLQYSCLENPMDREAWKATIHMVSHKESDTTEVT